MSHVQNKVFNRTLALLLSILMVVAAFPMGAVQISAASDEHPDVFTITVKNGENPVDSASVQLNDDADHVWTKTTDGNGVASFDEFTQKGNAGELSGSIHYTVSADSYDTVNGTVENAEAEEWAGNIDIALNKSKIEQKKVSVNSSGSGTATVKLNQTARTEILVNQGENVTLEIIPNEEDTYIKSVSIGEESKTIDNEKNYTETLTVNDDVTVSVVLNKKISASVDKNDGESVNSNEQNENNQFISVYTVALKYSSDGKFEVDENGVSSAGSVTLTDGSEGKMSLKALPNEGYRVAKVSINGAEETFDKNNFSFQKELDKKDNYSIKVAFSPNVYTVTTRKMENGNLQLEHGEVNSDKVGYNGSKTIYIFPDDGYTVDKAFVYSTAISGKPENGNVNFEIKSTEVKNITKDQNGIYFTIDNITQDLEVEVSLKKKEKALTSDISIDSSSALRKNEDETLIVIKKEDSVVFSTEKDGLRLYDDKESLIGGNEIEKTVSVSKSVLVNHVQVYYQAKGELYSDWHDVEIYAIDIVVDETNPIASLVPTVCANKNGYYKDDLEFDIKAEDPQKYSGIKKIEYYIQSGETEDDINKEGPTVWYENTGEPPVQQMISAKGAIHVNAKRHNSANVKVVLTVTDFAGNSFEKTQEIKINSTQPVVKLYLDGERNDSASKEIYKNRTLTIDVTDREDTFDKSKIAEGLVITKDEQRLPINAEDIHWSGENGSYQGTYTFNGDGIYNCSFSYTNKADYEAKVSVINKDADTFYNFKIDTKPPEVEISYEPSAADTILSSLTFGFYNSSVKVKLKAKDETAGIEKFEYSYVVKEDASDVNQGKSNVVVDNSNGEFTQEEDGYTSISFDIPPQFRGQVSFRATDKGGNTSELTTDGKVIVVDTIKPGVTVHYDDDAQAVNGSYYTTNRVATIEIKEANFFGTAQWNQQDFRDFAFGTENAFLTILVGKTTDDGEHTDTKQYPNFTLNGQEKDTYMATIPFEDEGDYTLTIQYTDRSGNEAVVSEYQKEFTIDKTNPNIEVSFDNNTAKNGKYFAANRKATFKVTEHNFDASTFKAGVKCSGSPMADFDTYLQKDSNWTHEGNIHTATIDFAVDGHYTFEPSCVDKAGNANDSVQFGESVSPSQFVIDTVSPKQDSLKISYSKSVLDIALEAGSFGFYKAPVTVTIQAEDETTEIDYFTYTYEVSNDASQKNQGKKDQVIAHSEIETTGNSATASFEIPAQFRGKVSFKAFDMAGNNEDKVDEKVIVVDNIAPGVTVSYDNNDARNEKYYNKDRVATITIDEANFFGDAKWNAKDLYDLIPGTDREYLAISVTKRLLSGDAEATSKIYPEFTKNGDIYTAKIEFKENADYKLAIEYTDRSENKGNVASYQKEFTVNKEAPKLSISYDNMDVRNNFYYKNNRTATIQIIESTFRASDVNFSISAVDVTGKNIDLSSKAYDTYLKDQNHWKKSSGNTWTAQLLLDIDGNYSLNLKYTNLAGTPQTKEINDSFCIDKVSPENMKISYEPKFVDVLLENLTFGFYKASVKVTIEAADQVAGMEYLEYSYSVQDGSSDVNKGKTKVRVKEEDIKRDGGKVSAVFSIPVQFRGFVSFDAIDMAGNKGHLADKNVVVVDNIVPEISVVFDNNDALYDKYYKEDRVATVTIHEANFFQEDLRRDDMLVITVEKTTDNGVHTTENVKPEFVKDGDVFTGTVEFKENADYKFSIRYTDRSGNEAVIGDYQKEFTIDKTAPAIHLGYDNNDSKNDDQFKNNRSATIQIIEHNFKSSDVEAVVMANGKEKEDYTTYLKDANSWTTDGDVHTAVIHFTDEAHYEFNIVYSDMAGNKNTAIDSGNSAAPMKFTLDKTAPTQLKIEIAGKSVLGTNSIAFDTFYDKPVTVKLSANCDISGLESLKYQKVAAVQDYDINGQWMDYDAEVGIVVSPSEKFIIYFRAEDRSGNISIVNSTGIVVDDKMPEGVDERNAPEIDIFPGSPNKNEFYNANVTVYLQVVDPKYSGQTTSNSGHYSGLKKITYRIYTTDMGKDVQETGTLMEIGGKMDGAIPDSDNLVYSWSGKIMIDPMKFNSNHVLVEVTAVDNAGNTRVTTTKSGDIQIDVTAPKINIRYSNNDADSNSFFKADRTATIVVTERNFNPNDIKVSIKNTEGSAPTLSTWTQTFSGTENKNDATWESTVTFNKDGDYTFDISYTDLADNSASEVNYGDSVSPTEFTIDKTLPTVSVSYNNNDATNDKYFKAPRTATVVVNEHNFYVDRVALTRTANLDGSSIALPNVSWVHEGDIHTATIPYNNDGDYTFDVSVRDLAGNVSTAADYGNSVASKEFTVDQSIEKPVIAGIEDGHAYKDNIVPTISFSDVNYDSYEVKLTRTRKDEIGTDVTEQFIGTINADAKGGSKQFDKFEKIVENDGIYSLMVRMVDKAGNEESQSLTFTVNRFGSVYEYGSYLISLIQNGGAYVGSVTDDIVITEFNASKLVADSLNIETTLDGRSIDTKFVARPVPNENVGVGESGWFQYQYVISKDNFAADGTYRITLSSEDEAKNTPESNPDNSTDENGNPIVDTMQFRVDSTAPEITNITGLETKVINEQTVNVRYSVYDAIGLKSITVFLDGKAQDPITEYDDINNYTGNFTINESSSEQKIRILVEDKAGNTIDTDDFGKTDANGKIIVPLPMYSFNNTVTVSTNFFVRWYANKPLFWGIIGGTLGLAVVLYILIVLIKKKKNKKDAK